MRMGEGRGRQKKNSFAFFQGFLLAEGKQKNCPLDRYCLNQGFLAVDEKRN
jgi:hypothetical protein